MAQAQKLEQMIADAKKEGEVTLVASASTFGGKKGFTELENAVCQALRLQRPAESHRRAELSAGGGADYHRTKSRHESSTDMYLGSDGTYVAMYQEKALEKSQLVGIFPWVTKEMEIIPQESLLVYASFHGIIYNSNAIPKDKAPKGYEDLIDPALSPAWAGKWRYRRIFTG